MTPKQKAKKLVQQFRDVQWIEENRETIKVKWLQVNEAKRCALILVSAIILENLRYDYTPFEGSRTAYFLEVEKEIKKLPKQITYETFTSIKGVG